jgi:hypothetical protein
MGLHPGQTNNPNGRPPGRVNKRTQAVLDLIHERGDTDPLVALSDIVTKNQDPSIVAQAANILAPYVHSKRGTIPAPRFVDEPIEVPDFQSIDQAKDFLAAIAQRAGRGELELQSANDISNLVRNWIEANLAHINTNLKVEAQGSGDATIRIEGGLPALPGTNINMTNELTLNNGHNVIDHVPEQVTIPVHGSVEPPKDDPLTDSSDGPSDGC